MSKNKSNKAAKISEIDVEILNQLVEQITSVAALDFSNKYMAVKGDGTPLDTIAIGLNMLSEELEDTVVSIDQLEENNRELENVISISNDFQFALDSSSIIVIIDIQGYILYVNDKFCEISKYSRSELIGKSCDIMDSGYHSVEFWKEMWQTIEQGKLWTREIKERSKDGSNYWVSETIVPFMDSEGRPYKYMLIKQDITLNKELEQRIMNSMIFSQEKDRELIAEDLHEGLAQSLAALMLQVEIVEMKIKEIADVELRNSVAFIKNYIQESIENTRVMATKLMPRTMMKYGVEPSLRAYITRLQQDDRQITEFNCLIKNKIDKDLEITIYRILVAILDYCYTKNTDKILIDLKSDKEIEVSVSIYSKQKSDLINKLRSEGYQKRVEIYEGQYMVDNDDDKLELNIIFNS